MDLVDAHSDSPTLISNAEVMQLLSDRLKSRETEKKKHKMFRHRDWIEEQVYQYLSETPCVRLDMERKDEFKSKLQSKKSRRINGNAKYTANGDKPKSAASGYGLTEAESLQILNFMPTEKVEIHIMIEELHARMSDEKQDEFLEFVGSYIKKEEEQEYAEDNGEDEEVIEMAEDGVEETDAWN